MSTLDLIRMVCKAICFVIILSLVILKTSHLVYFRQDSKRRSQDTSSPSHKRAQRSPN